MSFFLEHAFTTLHNINYTHHKLDHLKCNFEGFRPAPFPTIERFIDLRFECRYWRQCALRAWRSPPIARSSARF